MSIQAESEHPSGFIYLLSFKSPPQRYIVGATDRSPYAAAIEATHAHCASSHFEVLFALFVRDRRKVVNALHGRFASAQFAINSDFLSSRTTKLR
jgi:hypothetical protein